MDALPWENLLLMVTVDVAIVMTLSVFGGVVVGRAAGASMVKGGVVGLLPFLGPFVWAVVLRTRVPDLLHVGVSSGRSTRQWVASGLLVVAAVLVACSTFQSWGSADAAMGDYRFGLSGSPADTVVGAIATLGTAVLLIAVALMALLWTAWGRGALIAASLAAFWALVVVDLWIVLTSATAIADTVADVSAGRAEANLTLGLAAWSMLIAILLSVAASLILATLTGPGVAPSTAFVGSERMDVTADSSAGFGMIGTPSRGGLDYGDGF